MIPRNDGYDIDRQEGFTGAYNRTPWKPKFAWLPIRVSEGEEGGKRIWFGDKRKWAWLRSVEIKEYSAFGIEQTACRLPPKPEKNNL